MALIKINGRLQFFRRIETVTGSRGKFAVKAAHGEFRVEGGKRAGGTRRDWFLDWSLDGEDFCKSIHCTSLMDALRVIDGM